MRDRERGGEGGGARDRARVGEGGRERDRERGGEDDGKRDRERVCLVCVDSWLSQLSSSIRCYLGEPLFSATQCSDEQDQATICIQALMTG